MHPNLLAPHTAAPRRPDPDIRLLSSTPAARRIAATILETLAASGLRIDGQPLLGVYIAELNGATNGGTLPIHLWAEGEDSESALLELAGQVVAEFGIRLN